MAQGRQIDALWVLLGFKTDSKDLQKAARNFQQLDRKVNTTMRSIHRGLKVGFAALTGIGVASFNVGKVYERELLNLRTQLGLTGDEVEALKPKIEDMSRETGRPLEELAGAMFSVQSAGIRGADAMEVMEAAAKASAAGLGDTRSIALLAGGAINAYGSEVLSGADALDMLMATVEKGNLEAADLAGTMPRLFSLGSGLGVSFDELGASVAGFTRLGNSTSEAVTAVRATMAALQTPSGEAKKILEQVGLSVSGLHERIREEGFLDTLQFLNTAVDGDVEQMGKLFGSVESVSFVLDAAANNVDNYTDSLEGISASAGKVDAGFAIALESGVVNADQAVAGFKKTLTNFYNMLVVPLLKLLNVLPDAIQTVVLALGTLQGASMFGAPSVGQLGKSLFRVVRGLFAKDAALRTRVIPALKGFAATLQTQAIPALWRTATATWASVKASVAARWATLSSAVANSVFVLSLKAAAISTWRFIAGLSVMRIAQLLGAAASNVATGATIAFGVALRFALGPIGLIITAIGLLVAGIVLLVKNWDAVRDAIGRAWERVRSFFSGLPGWVTVALAVIAPFIGIPILIIKHWDTLKTFFANLWDWIVDKVMWAWNQVSGIFDAIGGFFGFGGGEIEVRTSTRANPAPPAVPTLDEGGIVRRPTLAMLAVNRQPEAVVPLSLLNQLTDKLKAMLNSLDRFIADFRATQAGKNFVANLPVLMDPSKPLFPTVPPRAFAGAGAGPTYIDNRTVNVSEGAVVVNAAPGQDPVEIAQVVTQRLRDQIQAIPPAFDSGIKR